ncbi:MAG: conjugal transfer protein [Candidatus Dormibacteria bacterium]
MSSRHVSRSVPREVKLVGRLFLWGAIAVVMVSGLVHLTSHQRALGAVGPTTESWAASGEAETFAARYAVDYLTYDEAHPEVRTQALAADLPPGGDTTAGWDRHGTEAATTALPMAAMTTDATHGLVTVAVEVVAAGTTRWEYLQVPIARQGSAFMVTAAPARVAGPTVASAQAPSTTSGDDQLAAELRPTLTSFFTAYAGGDVTYYLAPGASLHGLAGAVTFAGVSSVDVPAGAGDHCTAQVGVRWTDPASGATLTQSYRLSLVRLDGRWYVQSLAGAS